MKNLSHFFLILFVVGASFSAVADEKTGNTKCGESKVEIRGTLYPDSEFAFSKVILTAESKTESIRLVFERAEYFNAACIVGKGKHYFIVFQNYCSGSSCRDLDNYGIIDANSLEALLMPNDNNRALASRILGGKAPFLSDYKDRFF